MEIAASSLARTLHDLAYRRFAVLAGPVGNRTARARVAGFCAVLADLGCPVAPDAVVTTAFTRDRGSDRMRTLRRAGPPVEVVFAANDVIEVGAIAAAPDEGINVPGDVAVAGFNDIVTLWDVTLALAALRAPPINVGIAAKERAIAAPSSEPRFAHLTGDVVLRESTRRRASPRGLRSPHVVPAATQ